MAGHHRPIAGFGDLALDAEIAKDRLELFRGGVKLLPGQPGRSLARRGQQLGRRQAELAVTAKIKAALIRCREGGGAGGGITTGINDGRFLPLFPAGSPTCGGASCTFFRGGFVGQLFGWFGQGQFWPVISCVIGVGRAGFHRTGDKPPHQTCRHQKSCPLPPRKSGAPGPENQTQSRIDGPEIVRRTKAKNRCKRR